MANIVEEAIYQKAQKLVERHQTYAHRLSEHLKRRERRSGIPTMKNVKLPDYWTCAPGFRPYHVRKHYKSIAHAINDALDSNSYSPNSAVLHEIAKPGGGVRKLSVFQVADQAVSRLVFKRLREKNVSRLSPKCYAYRADLTIHNAVMNIASSFRGRQRIFIAEFDFKDFFPSISHQAVQSVLSDRHFYVTNREMDIVMKFLEAPLVESTIYGTGADSATYLGTPLGTSISSLVPNLVTYRFSEALEVLGVDFAFYSDDSLIWSNRYDRVANAAEVLVQTANEMGIKSTFQNQRVLAYLPLQELLESWQGKTRFHF